MLRRFFWSWLRRWFFRKTNPLTNGRRSGQRSSRLGLESLEDRAVPATAVALNQAFVATLYEGLLDRPADSTGLAYWSGQLNAGSSRTAVASGILNSPEFTNDEIANLYQQLLSRSANGNELAYWSAQKQAGNTWQQIEAGMAGSAEFFTDAGGTFTAYVSRLFQDFLHRLPAANEFGFFQQLANANTPNSVIALDVISSPEADGILVNNDYSTILGRAADASGAAYWTAQLEQGADQNTVLAGFAGSAEYAGQLQKFLSQQNYTDANSAAQSFVAASATFGPTSSTLPAGTAGLSGNSLVFEPNVGQGGGTTSQFQFLAHGGSYTIFLTNTGPVLSFSVPAPASTTQAGSLSLALHLDGSNPNPVSSGIDELGSYSNYIIGNDPSQWHTDVANYQAVTYRNVYNGIDLVYQGVDSQLEHEFVVHAGADPGAISFDFPGWSPSIGSDGSLILFNAASNTTMVATAPVLSQGTGSRVSGGFVLLGGGRVGYQVGAYDHSRTLTIDPTFIYSTLLGGSKNDVLRNTSDFNGLGGFLQGGMALDPAGNAYVTGTTDSVDFPVTPGSFATTAPNKTTNVFITKLNANGNGLIYSTYLGNGKGTSSGGIAVDSQGFAYVTGDDQEFFSSPTFPITAGAYDANPGFQNNVFVTKLNQAGNGLVFSTFLGGNFFANGFAGDSGGGLAIALDGAGDSYVTGSVAGPGIQTTPGAIESNTDPRVQANANNAFVVKVNPTGTSLDYATYVTGTGAFAGLETGAFGIAVGSNGNAYITGKTDTTDFPTTPNAFQKSATSPNYNAFLAELNNTGTALVYSTFLGGSTGGSNGKVNSAGYGIAVDQYGDMYVVGLTNANNFPVSAGTYQSTLGAAGSYDAFLTKFESSGTLTYSTYLGGNGDDVAYSVAVDRLSDVFVGGATQSSNFPNVNPVQSPLSTPSLTGANKDGFIVQFNPFGNGLVFASNIGGLADDEVDTVALDPSNNIYVAGQTKSTSGPNTTNGSFPVNNAFQSTNNGGTDAFVANLTPSTTLPPLPPPPPPPPPPPGGGGGTTSPPPLQTVVSASDIYAPNQTSDMAYDFGSLPTVTIFSYDNLNITDQPNGQFEWYKWEASAAGTFYATQTTTSGGPLEMHLFEVLNGVLTELRSNTGGTLSTSLTQGQAIYIEVKGENTAPGVKSTGTYNLDVALQP